jgi:hypothetical protein
VLLSSPQPKKQEAATTASTPSKMPARTPEPAPTPAPAAAEAPAPSADNPDIPALPPTTGIDTSGINFLPPEENK